MDYEEKATRMRKVIAKNMVDSWHTSPKCDYEMMINAEPMMRFVLEFKEKNSCKISYLNVVSKAAAIALKEYPYLNSAYDQERNVHIIHEEINIGFAVSIENGLMVADIRGADQLDLKALNAETARLIDAIRSGVPRLDDVTGSTLTINNMGKYKRLIHHNAIINQPELAILSMYCIAEKPVIRDGQIIIQECMNLMLSADHRVIDGDMACAFLDRICEILENPYAFMN